MVRENKDTAKVRIVFDASSKVRDELSLTDCLYSGPCLLPAVYHILLGFSLGKIGLVSDVNKFFEISLLLKNIVISYAFYAMLTSMLMILKLLFYNLHQ